MHAAEQTRIAHSASPDEVREVYLVLPAQGGVHLMQYSWGNLTRLAYGDDAICHRLSLDARALAQLAARLGWGDDLPCRFAGYFGQDEASLTDLLDICDREGIAYGFCSVGKLMGTVLRRGGHAG